MTREQFEQAVERAKHYIHEGDAFQVVPSQRWSGPCPVEAFSVYRGLRNVNPSPYMYFLEFDDFAIAGRVAGAAREGERLPGGNAGRSPARARARPARRKTCAARAELLEDEKERAEHVMLVDLGRNDLGSVCEFGSVEVEELMAIETYSHVMHIVSSVKGTLRPQLGGMDALRACLPAGTLSGAPKIRAMEIIDELEPDEARLLRWRGRLPQLLRRPRHLHPHPHGRRQGRDRPCPGRRRRGRRFRPRLRVPRDRRQGRGRVPGNRACMLVSQTGPSSARMGSGDRQLRQLHLQPRPVPGGARSGAGRRAQRRTRPSTSCCPDDRIAS